MDSPGYVNPHPISKESIMTPIIGDLIGWVVNKVGDIIGKHVADKDLAAQLTHDLESQISTQNHEFATLIQTTEQAMFEAQQKTIQAELAQSDLYTKRTRPKLARIFAYLGILCTLFTTVGAPIVTYLTRKYGYEVMLQDGVFAGVKFQADVFVVITSPVLTYMGVRTFDKWKMGGGSA